MSKSLGATAGEHQTDFGTIFIWLAVYNPETVDTDKKENNNSFYIIPQDSSPPRLTRERGQT